MKRTILISLVSIFILGLSCPQALAKEKSLPLTATASSTFNNSLNYSPAKAVDGDKLSCWVGGNRAAPWWIMFDTGVFKHIAKININWSSSKDIPLNYDIQISSDGTSWEALATGLRGVYDVNGEVKEIGRKTRYIRLYIKAVKGNFPILRELSAVTEIRLPRKMRFQARLGDAQGGSLEGTFTLTCRLYDSETGRTCLWEETQPDVVVEDGLLDIELGSITALALAFDEQYWLGLEVNSDGEMFPRFKLTTVPYAFISEE